MTRPQQRVKYEFVELIPKDLSPNTLYISTTYATCSHLCLCGCGNKVVTPLAPNEWQLTFDGENISLYPSIGNWSFDCQSHYWIDDGYVSWARAWSKEKIEANRARERRSKRLYYGTTDREPTTVAGLEKAPAEKDGRLRRLLCRLKPHRRRAGS